MDGQHKNIIPPAKVHYRSCFFLFHTVPQYFCLSNLEILQITKKRTGWMEGLTTQKHNASGTTFDGQRLNNIKNAFSCRSRSSSPLLIQFSYGPYRYMETLIQEFRGDCYPIHTCCRSSSVPHSIEWY